MSLTDDWKAGKLKRGFYYIKISNGKIVIDEYNDFEDDGRKYFYTSWDSDVIEVLDLVPSYENLQELEHFNGKNVCAENEVLRLKIAELEEELQEVHSKKNWANRRAKYLFEKNKHLEDLQANQDKEVENLKKLLKTCRDILEVEGFYPTVCEINTVIGESEE